MKRNYNIGKEVTLEKDNNNNTIETKQQNCFKEDKDDLTEKIMYSEIIRKGKNGIP